MCGSLRILSPVLQEAGALYERTKFQQMVDSGALSLQRVTAWIRSGVNQSGGDQREEAVAAIHLSAMLSLVMDPVRISKQTIPETLLMDVRHLLILQFQFDYIVKNTVLLVMANQAIQSPRRNNDALNSALTSRMCSEIEFEDIIMEVFRKRLVREMDDADARDQLVKSISSAAADRNNRIRRFM